MVLYYPGDIVVNYDGSVPNASYTMNVYRYMSQRPVGFNLIARRPFNGGVGVSETFSNQPAGIYIIRIDRILPSGQPETVAFQHLTPGYTGEDSYKL